MEDASESLKQLQEELLQLRQQVQGLQLKKSTAAQSRVAPFPITTRAEVTAPLDAERFDVASFTLLARLSNGLLPASPKAPADASLPEQQQQRVAAAVEVEVCSRELPRALREAMAQRLHSLWVASGPAPGGRLNLALLWGEARRQFATLLSLIPELLESYQTEDALGSTVRRWVVLNDQASITIDASVCPAPKLAAAPAAAGSLAAVPPTRRQQPVVVPAQRKGGAAVAAAAGTPQLPRGLEQELELLRKRHGLRRVPLDQEAARTCGVAAGDAAAAELAGLHLTGSPAPTGAAGASSCMPGPSGQHVVAAFELELRPTDPAWDASHLLLLHGWTTAGYPQAGCLHLEVSRQQQPPLPLLHRQVLDRLLAAEVTAAVGTAGVLRDVLRHLENHAGQLWEQAEDIAVEVARRRRQQGERPPQQATQTRQPEGWHEGWQGRGGSESGGSASEFDNEGAYGGGGYSSEGSSSSGDSSSGPDEAEAGEQEADADGGGSGGHSGVVLPLALHLEGLQLVDVDALELLRVNLQVTCQRCRASGELSFASVSVAPPSAEGGASSNSKGGGSKARGGGTLTVAAECATCHAEWAVEVAPKLLHERSNMLAHVRAQGCAPADLLPSMLAGQCSQCASSAAFRSVVVGRWNERACSSCHMLMRFQFSTALFVPHRQGSRPQQSGAGGQQTSAEERRAGGSGAAAGGAAFEGLLQIGQPLPDRGTCKHYKHSYRWLRFPCCGRRFPCDLCHEELTDGHEMKWANRMVCGLCSTEMPVAPQCKACGKKLSTSASAPSGRHTRFWEGGKGQRDPSKLHKDDPRRHRSKFKTCSGKSKRVGQEGKARRDHEQQQE